ncbi:MULTISPECIES: DUF3613 domain-containing protein [unclassified Methylophilus]|jgi:hypothetical protein|uniref:DUF3613 domain-containing protein n=1 Tax=unclassified Methylophilus TaxID=2630143 RepID=UPI000361F5E5|nr:MULTISPECIES: DUF3613 domain-containing protein [unclassified Methylophilus]HCU83959.1 DUF3613 domain-containing protein [Methylophilus sp.]
MKRFITLALCGFFSVTHAMAEDNQAIVQPPARALSPTQQWLELQRSGKAASPQAQPVSGEVMDKVHSRYIKSFEKPIPEYYEHAMPTTR